MDTKLAALIEARERANCIERQIDALRAEINRRYGATLNDLSAQLMRARTDVRDAEQAMGVRPLVSADVRDLLDATGRAPTEDGAMFEDPYGSAVQ